MAGVAAGGVGVRIRSIKPEFWEDVEVAAMSVQTRLTFIGLWNLADDGGVLRSNIDEISAALYRFETRGRRNRHVSDAITALTAGGMLELLPCGRHARVVHLSKHQRLAGEGRQVHTFGREHDAECGQISHPRKSPHIPAAKRGVPANPRTSPPSRARAGRGGKGLPTVTVEGGVGGEDARVVPPRGATTGSRSGPTNGDAIDTNIAIANDSSRDEAVRRAARRAVERHAPERLGEIGAAS